jgi:16S rRNA (guanine527-N7)-methyltransferase
MDIIRKYFPDVSIAQLEQFQQFRESILFWNKRINLISRKDVDHLTERHVLHSLAIAKFAAFGPGDTILDVGTGGGFPGIPLAILIPDAQFTLIDSIGKKVYAVNQIIHSLGIDNAGCQQVRAENYPDKARHVVSRAVTNLVRFTSWVKSNIEPPSRTSPDNGIWYLKGGDLQDELSTFKKVRIFSLDEVYSEAFFESKKLLHLPYHSLY